MDTAAMSEDDIALVNRALDAFNAGGAALEAAGDPPPGIYAEEAELVPLRGALEGTVYTGRHPWRDFWKDSRDSWSKLRLDIESFEEIGDGVLAIGTLYGTSRGTNAPVEARIAFAAHIRDGRIWRNAVHLDPAKARRELEPE